MTVKKQSRLSCIIPGTFRNISGFPLKWNSYLSGLLYLSSILFLSFLVDILISLLHTYCSSTLYLDNAILEKYLAFNISFPIIKKIQNYINQTAEKIWDQRRNVVEVEKTVTSLFMRKISSAFPSEESSFIRFPLFVLQAVLLFWSSSLTCRVLGVDRVHASDSGSVDRVDDSRQTSVRSSTVRKAASSARVRTP